MVLISALGTIPAVLTLISTINYAVDLKRGLVLINVIAWTAMLTYLGKYQIDYPRPIDVDPGLKTIYFPTSEKDLTDLLPSDFFKTFSTQLLEQTRNDVNEHYGFPSGHTSIQVALWISLFFLFRKRWIRTLGIIAVALTIFSRIYLGHHFLGDTIGGLILGLLISSILILLIKKTNYLNTTHQQFKSLSILWIPVFLVPFISHIPVWLLGSLIGLNAASILIIQYKNFPVFHILPFRRVLAAIICIGMLMMAFYINKTFIVFDIKFIELVVISLISFFIVGGSLLLCQKLNLIRFRF